MPPEPLANPETLAWAAGLITAMVADDPEAVEAIAGLEHGIDPRVLALAVLAACLVDELADQANVTAAVFWRGFALDLAKGPR